jgi:hypothetical protein
MSILQFFKSHWIGAHEVRREAFALGGRHQGDVLLGARAEMAKPGIPFRRSILLRAVIRSDARAKAVKAREAAKGRRR